MDFEALLSSPCCLVWVQLRLVYFVFGKTEENEEAPYLAVLPLLYSYVPFVLVHGVEALPVKASIDSSSWIIAFLLVGLGDTVNNNTSSSKLRYQ